MTFTMSKVIRPIKKTDLDVILGIEGRSFSLPFTRQMFESLLEQDLFDGFVSEVGGQTAGYLIYSLVIDEMQLITIATDTPWRKKGIAEGLMKRMMEVADASEVKVIFLEVRVSNVAARSLYDKFGFKKVGLRKGYYQDNGEDAITMARDL